MRVKWCRDQYKLIVTNKEINIHSNYKNIMPHKIAEYRYGDQFSNQSPYEIVFEQIVLKGAVYIGAAIGLYIALKMLGKI